MKVSCHLTDTEDLQIIPLTVSNLTQAIDDIVCLNADIVILVQDSEQQHADIVGSCLAEHPAKRKL